MDGTPTERFARCIAASKRVRWDVETDVIRGRRFDLANKFLPDGLTLVTSLPFLAPEEKLAISARFRAALTPTCSAWSNALSMPRSSN